MTLNLVAAKPYRQRRNSVRLCALAGHIWQDFAAIRPVQQEAGGAMSTEPFVVLWLCSSCGRTPVEAVDEAES